jgi:hypothetical protein
VEGQSLSEQLPFPQTHTHHPVLAKMFATAFVIAAVALPQVLAHGGVLSYDIGTTHYAGFAPYNSASGQT